MLAQNENKITKKHVVFFIVVFTIGMFTEIVGVNTGLLFGDYQYGMVLGPKLYGVPFLIGLNWFIIVVSSGSIFSQFVGLVQEKYRFRMTETTLAIAVVIGGATIATCFDYILEPVAIKLHFWT